MSLNPKARLQSFGYAFRGIAQLLRTEVNARIHVLAAVAVVVVGLSIGIDRFEWLAIVLAVTAVWCAEAFNTAIESVCDAVSQDHHPKIERAKDIAAGAVLLAAIGSVGVGIIVFGPPLLALLVP